MKIEKENKFSFLDVNIICKQVNIPTQFVENLYLAVHIVPLKVFTFINFHINLAWYIL